jgi:hypothetical protein
MLLLLEQSPLSTFDWEHGVKEQEGHLVGRKEKRVKIIF